MITDQDVQTFRDHGFIVKRSLLTAEEVRQIAAWTDEIAHWPEIPGKYMMYFETSLVQPDERLLSRIENFFPYHAGFHTLLTSNALLGGAARLFGEPAVLFKDKINFKLPGANGFKAHQDVQAGWNAYASLHLTAMVTIDAATIENGCLEIASGHHDRGLIGRMWEPLIADDTVGMTFTPCICQPGDVAFFDSFTPHRSSPNLSNEPRRVLYITYNRRTEGDHRVQYYADKRRNYPPDCERDVNREYRFKV
ncbi:MAG TPA: phytanoyl-CoA dioxygenase family protein [Gammaproteobacteria bacterium]|nr:phytanoyl-CoA dioxygenase family protein [Gammaproteobacteria bacterium]